MMGTYRERRERRAERLRDWAGGNEQKGDARLADARRIADGIPMGQPILVGHHSERRHRRDIAKIEGGMRAGIDLARKAERQVSSADEIERQLAASIYDDDPDAIERLTEKLAAMERRRDEIKAKRAAVRKEQREALKGLTAWQKEEVMRATGAPQYSVTNLTGNITRTRDRLARLKRERETGPRDRLISARFTSECASCGAELVKGTSIRYNRQQGARCYPGCATEGGAMMGYRVSKQYEGVYHVLDEDGGRVARVARFMPGPMVSVDGLRIVPPALAPGDSTRDGEACGRD